MNLLVCRCEQETALDHINTPVSERYRPASSQLEALWGEVFGAEVDKVSLRVPGVRPVAVGDPEAPPCRSFW